MANEEFTINFGADTTSLTEGIENVRKRLAALNTSLTENKQKINDTSNELKKLQKEEKELASAMKDGGTKEQQAQMQQLKDKIAQTTANLGQLKATEAETKADIRNTTSELQKQKAGLDDNTKSTGLLEKALGKLGTTAKAFISIYGAKKLWDVLIGSNAEMEQYQTSFEVMLGDAEKAKRMIEDLRDLAAKTPLAMSDVISTGTLLMNYGVDDSDLIGTMTKLGDLASGNAEKLNRVSLAYGQMLAKGKVTGEELRQMTEAGVPLQDALAKSIGVTGEEFSKMVSAGKVGITDLNKAIDELTTGDGKFAGMMEKQSQTMNGMLSTLKDNVSEFLRQLGEGAFGEVKDVLADVMEQMKQWEEDGTLEKLAEKLGVAVETLVKIIEWGIEVVANFGVQIVEVFAGVAIYKGITKLRELKDKFVELKEKIQLSTAALKESGETTTSATKSWKDFFAVSQAGQVALSVIGVVITATAAKMFELEEATDEYNRTLESLEKNSQSTIAKAEAENQVLSDKVDRYEELRTAAELTAAGEAELKSLAAELQEVFGEDITVVDKLTGKYNNLKDALADYTAQRIASAQQEAAYNYYAGLLEEQAELQLQLETLKANASKNALQNASYYYSSTKAGVPQWENQLGAALADVGTLGFLDYGEGYQIAALQLALDDLNPKVEAAKKNLGDVTEAMFETGDASDNTKDKVNDLTEETEDQTAAVKELNDMLDALSSAYKEQQENGQLSYKTIMSLIDAGYAQCLQIDSETNTVKLNAEAYRDLAKAKIEARMAELQTSNVYSAYDSAIRTAELDGDMKKAMQLRAEKAKYTLSPEQAANAAELAALQQIYDNLDGYMSGGSSHNPYGSSSEYTDAYNAYKTEADRKMQLIKDELAAKKELRDKTIAYLDEEIKKRKELNEDNDMQKQIDKVKAQLEYAQLDEFSRGQLEKELKNLEEERDEMLWQRDMQARKDEANAAYEAASENAAKAQEQISNAVNTVKEIMDNLANGITNISNIISNNTNTVNNTANINLASQALTMAQITKAVKDALIGTVLIR